MKEGNIDGIYILFMTVMWYLWKYSNSYRRSFLLFIGSFVLFILSPLCLQSTFLCISPVFLSLSITIHSFRRFSFFRPILFFLSFFLSFYLIFLSSFLFHLLSISFLVSFLSIYSFLFFSSPPILSFFLST